MKVVVFGFLIFLSGCESCAQALHEDIGYAPISAIIIEKEVIENDHGRHYMKIRQGDTIRELNLNTCYAWQLWEASKVGDSIFKPYIFIKLP